MDLEQIITRLEWLDDERRKDKTLIAALQQQVSDLEAQLPKQQKMLKEVSSDVAHISGTLARLDQMQEGISNLRVEFTRSLENIEKLRAEKDRDQEQTRRSDLETLNKSIAELRKGMESVSELKMSMQARVEEEFRLNRAIQEMQKQVEDNLHMDEEYRRNQRLISESQRQDSKRLTDLQAETAGMRKRLDEQRGRFDLASDTLSKLELRFNETQLSETERKQNLAAFIDKQNLLNLERDQAWKEWEERFDGISAQSANLDAKMLALDTLQRDIRRAQDGFNDIQQRFDRRVNEITEMQRLTEERFRQEWVNFKADDQKRWTNYTLAQEEQQRETNRHFEKSEERLTNLEDLTQEMNDLLNQTTQETQSHLQGLIAMMHDWLEEHQRNFSGRS
jgi:chromosome segregation ATPase